MIIFILIAAIIFFLLVIPFVTANFTKSFLFYVFIFIPLYLFALDLYVRIFRPPFISDSIRLIKDFAWICILTGFVCWLLLRKGEGIQLPKSMALPFLILLLFLLVQWVRGYFVMGAYGAALSARNMLSYIPAVFIAPMIIKREGQLLLICKLFCFVMIFAGFYGFIQVMFNMPSMHYILTPRGELKAHTSSFFADYNAFGWFAAISFPFILLYHRLGRSKQLSFTALGFSILAIVICQSRTALIAFFVLLLFISFQRGLPVQKILVPLILVAIVIIFINPNMLLRHRLTGGVTHDVRFTYLWPALWKYFLEKPYFGHGLGIFGTAGYKFLASQGRITNFLVDNFYFTVLLNTGIVGLALFMFFIIAVFHYSLQLVRLTRKNLCLSGFAGATVISLIIFCVFSVSSNFLESFPESVYFWFLVGVICAIGTINYKNKLCEISG
jgi:O-antigen ligase